MLCYIFMQIFELNWIEQWLQNKQPLLKCKLFYDEMNFLKKLGVAVVVAEG